VALINLGSRSGNVSDFLAVEFFWMTVDIFFVTFFEVILPECE
jgi:hypothetical protein